VTRLAIFDLDRTLVRGSSLAILGRALLGSGLVPARPVLAELLRSRHYARRGEGAGQAEAVLTRLLACARGRDVEALTAAVAGAVDRVEREVYPTAARLLALHRAAGDVCVVLSASPQELVEAVGRRLGAHIGIGTRPEVIDGRLTGRLVGPFCHGEGKLARLREELGDLSLDGATAYADSASDLPVLRACGDPVAVNPDRGLAAVARQERWPVLRLQ
jgi:HAD superfamily hydrolase (TIGR01490 family)